MSSDLKPLVATYWSLAEKLSLKVGDPVLDEEAVGEIGRKLEQLEKAILDYSPQNAVNLETKMEFVHKLVLVDIEDPKRFAGWLKRIAEDTKSVLR